ncbi:MAG: hypothetical protein Q8L62_12170 [Candidatus Nitrotoga sp.]|nr:hypothetical protein [Candidatus Nitrotoga sp.]
MNSIGNITQAKQLSVAAIDSSPHIAKWLSQFSSDKQITAKMMLSKLQFISRDMYSKWFRKTIAVLPSVGIYALYSVRKLKDDETVLWNEQGQIIARPGISQGSEDLVYSLISNAVRSNQTRYMDHPSICDLHTKRVHDIVLIDDSIGSGDRVSKFINAMLRHATFLSWWSLGLIKVHIISFARPRETESKIIAKIRGSDHGKRKFRKSSKVFFSSEVVYSTDGIESRWGINFRDILDICDQPAIWSGVRRGWGEVMANIVFYHSVPDNLPAVIWFKDAKWEGLFPERALPDWLLALIDAQNNRGQTERHPETNVPNEIINLLRLTKLGVRSIASIALRLNCDHIFATALLEKAKASGFLNEHHRLTSAGVDILKALEVQSVSTRDRTLYIPTSWCAGQTTIQPLTSEEIVLSVWADSVEEIVLADGGVGQTSLERSDAKAAAPPSSVMSQLPAKTGMSHDTDGPLGSKER